MEFVSVQCLNIYVRKTASQVFRRDRRGMTEKRGVHVSIIAYNRNTTGTGARHASRAAAAGAAGAGAAAGASAAAGIYRTCRTRGWFPLIRAAFDDA